MSKHSRKNKKTDTAAAAKNSAAKELALQPQSASCAAKRAGKGPLQAERTAGLNGYGWRFTSFIDKALSWGLGLLCLFVSVSFYTGTYDTAFVKITLLQCGGIVLISLWLALLAVQKRWPFSRRSWPWLLPFVAYFGWNFFVYVFSAYKAEGFDEFFRYVLYFLLGWIVLDRFTKESARILTKCIILAAWLSCLYGLVQVVDQWLPGADVLPWRGFFGTRIFSTHANPNFFADFLVFSSFIVFAEFLRTKQKRLLVLLGIAAVDLFFTESKGAWLGFAASAVFFAVLFAHSAAERSRKQLRLITVSAAIVLLAAAALAGVYAAKRFQSVSFRAYTWSSVFAMVQDSPVMGTGVGSFKTIYPAYRKPQIFYIEKIHNNETQHAENEYLEQWATAGTVGLAIFLWLLFFVLYAGWQSLRFEAEKARQTAGKWPAKAWWLLGYSAAFFGIIVHNAFDISMRFVSTGLFFSVFAALVVRLSVPQELEPAASETAAAQRSGWLLWLCRAVLAAAVIALAGYYIYMFAQTAGNTGVKNAGEALLKWVAWGTLCFLTLGGAWLYLRAAFLARWVRVSLILLLSVMPLQWVYGFFLSDHFYGIAAEFSRRQMFEGALEYYGKAIEYNPLVASYYQYRSYILRQTQDLQRSYSPLKGDEKPAPAAVLLNDYDRALRDLDIVARRAPNHALLHQAYGEFYYTYAVLFTQLSQTAPLAYQRAEYEQKAVENMELAKKSFRHSLLLDPVNAATYVYLVSISMMERDPASAQAWIEAYRRGPQAVTEKEFLQTHQHEPRLEQMEQRLRLPPFNYNPGK